jgi:hypothetical protein
MPPAYGGGPTPQPSRTNGMSIASLVLGLVGIPLCFLFIPSVLAIAFGFVGLSQIKNDPTQKGRGLAIAGVILGAVMLALIALAFAFGNTEYTFDT